MRTIAKQQKLRECSGISNNLNMMLEISEILTEEISMQTQGYIYYCTAKCPIRKKCFVIKTEQMLSAPLIVLKKCEARKGQDIRIIVGETRFSMNH